VDLPREEGIDSSPRPSDPALGAWVSPVYYDGGPVAWVVGLARLGSEFLS